MTIESELVPEFTFAFQPIVDAVTHEVLSYEALIRGLHNESAYGILSRVSAGRMHLFDQEARVRAVGLAASLGLDCNLNLNFLPMSLYSSAESVLTTLRAATENHIRLDRIMLEVLEGEVVADQQRFARLINEYRALGVGVAIDDFGAGYAGLSFLANFQPDQIKLDMELVRGIERHGPRQAIVRALVQACGDLGIEVIAEGVETAGEYTWLFHAGVQLFQGYLFAKPAFESFPPVHYPEYPEFSALIAPSPLARPLMLQN